MKKYLYIAAGILLAACSPKKNYSAVEITNTLDFDRVDEVVCINVDPNTVGKIVDADGMDVPYQVTDNGIILQATVPANSSVTLSFDATQPGSTPADKTAVFFLGDRRKDDFAFENDKAGYRMYGPALLNENPSNGVDLWLKHIADPVMDTMYKEEEGGKPYHIDWGYGLDSYKVGHAVGCGGVALISEGKAWVGGPYAKWEVLQAGPLQSIFKLEYDSILVGEKILTETITITVNAGSQVNKAEVVFNGENIDGLQVGGGIFLHEDMGNLKVGDNFIAYAESATSDKGIYGVHARANIDATELDFGRNYVAVIVPGMENAEAYDITEVASKNYKVGESFVYYFGGGWSKRDFSTDEEWFEATHKTEKAIANPLQVTLK